MAQTQLSPSMIYVMDFLLLYIEALIFSLHYVEQQDFQSSFQKYFVLKLVYLFHEQNLVDVLTISSPRMTLISYIE